LKGCFLRSFLITVREKRAITPDTALRLARYFGASAEFWLNLQTAYVMVN
jgi:addiction module HigA family antidote